ncbi:MAG: HAD-IA family hydrolase [Proteobacteria bacterium]|nr:HAD-IA family hydrolase [Pseudomonadota bacterium]
MSQIQAILFDLDGTLADTAPDLGYALNLLLAEHNRPTLPHEIIRPVASHGTKGLIKLGFDIGPEHPGFNALKHDFLAYYEQYLCHKTSLFPGVNNLLAQLKTRHVPWGIVTNKPFRYTQPLIRALNLDNDASCCISGDTTPFSKPHPEPLLFAARQLGYEPKTCLYVGDAKRDIEAARLAEMNSLVALYGYLASEDEPETWQASGLIKTPAGLLDFL